MATQSRNWRQDRKTQKVARVYNKTLSTIRNDLTKANSFLFLSGVGLSFCFSFVLIQSLRSCLVSFNYDEVVKLASAPLLMMLRGMDLLSLAQSEESSQIGKRMISEMRDIRRLPVTGAWPTSFGSKLVWMLSGASSFYSLCSVLVRTQW